MRHEARRSGVRRWRLVAAAALMLAVAGCGGGSDEDTAGAGSEAASASETAAPDLAKAGEQARQYKTMGMPDDWINFGAFFTALCQEHGWDCTGKGTGPNRFDTDASSAEEIAEFNKRAPDGPVMADIGIAFGQVAEREGVTLQYQAKGADQLPPGFREEDGGWVASAVGTVAFTVNNDVVKNPPKTWDDLLKPEYKGQISMSDPTTSGTGQATVFSVAWAKGGGQIDLDAAIDYFRKLQTSGNLSSGEYSAATMEKGETPIRLQYDFVGLIQAAEIKKKGVNVTVQVPTDGGVWAPSALMPNKFSDKPDLAKAILDFNLTDRGQLVYAEFGARPVRFVTGDLEVPAEYRRNWLPDSQYQKMGTVESWPDPGELADRWENEVLS
jgi:putative spermidine/putrescine transport system substrate-binding protein